MLYPGRSEGAAANKEDKRLPSRRLYAAKALNNTLCAMSRSAVLLGWMSVHRMNGNDFLGLKRMMGSKLLFSSVAAFVS